MTSRFGSATSLIATLAPTGASALPITAVGADVAARAPSVFFAVTRTRTVFPTSTDVRTYVFCVAPLMSEQLPPVWSQRRHWYANAIGCPPVHVPGFAVSVWPCCGVPLIVGCFALTGRPAVAEARTVVEVAFEFALAVPSAFEAMTRERMRWPTSARRRMYVRRVSPGIVAQLTPFTPPPLASQRSQR